MRLNDLSGGSIKTLFILVLILANIAVALAHHRSLPQLSRPGGGGAAPAVSRASRDTLPALPGQPPR